MKRLIEQVEDPRLERLAMHLRQIAAPLPTPSPRALAEIAARVRRGRAPRRGWMLAAAAALLALWLSAPRRRPVIALEAPGVATAEPARTPSVLQIPSLPPRRTPLKLSGGHLVVRADEQPTTVEVPGGRVVVPAGGRARIEVRGYSVRVAAWRGSVTVAWEGTTVVIPAGETRTVTPNESDDANANANANTSESANASASANANANANVSDEAALLSRALRRLRVEHDADGARQLLDEHDRRFPAGALSTEAQRLRHEAEERR